MHFLYLFTVDYTHKYKCRHIFGYYNYSFSHYKRSIQFPFKITALKFQNMYLILTRVECQIYITYTYYILNILLNISPAKLHTIVQYLSYEGILSNIKWNQAPFYIYIIYVYNTQFLYNTIQDTNTWPH